jgi:alkylhydroperoxidase family enzyme
MARIAPLEPPYRDDVDEELRSMMPPGVPPIALFRTLVRNRSMAQAIRPWGAYELGRQLTISLRQREIVIDRMCAQCGCEYEWCVHIAFFAARAGLDDVQITSLTHGGASDSCWIEPGDRLLIEAVDQLHETSDLTDGLWAALADVFEERQLLDLVLLAGWYHAISFVARATRVANEPAAPRFADFAP